MAGPTYTYTPDVPQASQPFNQTQAPILSNFRAINEYVGVNHIGFNISGTYGKHTFLSLPYQSDDPGTASTDIAMFTKETPSGDNDAEVFFQNPDNGTVSQLTNVNTPTEDTTIPSGTAGSGWCKFSESGMIMKWGQATVTVAAQSSVSNNVTRFTLPTGSGIPVYTQAIFFCQISLVTNSSGSNTYSGIGASAFSGGNRTTTYINLEQVSTSPITITFNWFTIGI